MKSKEQSRGLPMIGLTLQKSLNAPKTPTAHKMSHKSKKKCLPKCGSFAMMILANKSRARYSKVNFRGFTSLFDNG